MVAQTKPRHTPFILAGVPHGLHLQIHSTWNNSPTSHHFPGVQIKGLRSASVPSASKCTAIICKPE